MNDMNINLECEEIAKCISIMQEMIEKIEADKVGYSELCADLTDFWGDGVGVALSHVDIKPPFEYSFDEYSDEWYGRQKNAVLSWFKTLVLEMSMLACEPPYESYL